MTSKRIAVVVLVASVLGGVASARAEITVAEYLELSIERLEMALATWAGENRPPEADEESALCETYGISSEEYHAFSGAHQEQIVAYLEDNPELAETIQSLSDQITGIIEQSQSEAQE